MQGNIFNWSWPEDPCPLENWNGEQVSDGCLLSWLESHPSLIFFLAAPGLWCNSKVLSCLTRVPTQAPCTGSTESSSPGESKALLGQEVHSCGTSYSEAWGLWNHFGSFLSLWVLSSQRPSLLVSLLTGTVMRLLSKRLIQRRKSVRGAHLRTWQLLRVMSFIRIDESKWKQNAKCQLTPHWFVANNAHLPSSIIFEGNGKLLKEQKLLDIWV